MNTKALRQKVLDLAIHGKLVPQNPADESAEKLLEKIRAEKAEKIKKGELKADKKDSFIFVGSDKRHYEQFADGTVKDIEDEIPFEVPAGWAWCRLPEICLIPITDGTHQTPTYSDKENGVPFLSSKDVTSGKIDWSKIKYITKDLHQELQKRIAPKKNDILLAKNGTTGVAAIVEDETIFDIYVTLAVLRPNQNVVYPSFLLNIINSPFCKNQFNDHLTGIGVPNLHLVDINKTFIALPPLNEQKQITNKIESYISHIDEIEKNKSDLQNTIKQTKSKILDLAIHGKLVPQDSSDEPAEELLKRIATSDNRPYKKLSEDEVLFDIPSNWIWCYMGDIFNHTTGKALKKSNNTGTLRKYITTSNLYWNSFDFTEVRSMYFTAEELEKCTIKKGDLILCNGGDVGRAAIWNYDYDICYQNHVSRLRPKSEDIDNSYFLYLLMIYKEQGMLNGKGVGITSLSANDLLSSVVPLPPLSEQKRIVTKIEELFAQLDTISEQLA